jgi:hypothetical protein
MYNNTLSSGVTGRTYNYNRCAWAYAADKYDLLMASAV